MTLLEEIYSPGRTWKAEIWKREDNTLRIVLRRYRYEAVPEHDHVGHFWVVVPTHASITDDIDITRTIANELLARHAANGE